MNNYFRIITLILAIALTFVAGLALAEPRLTIPETSFNFGYVPQHATISHKFWLISTGQDTLKILNVIPGCGCTKAPLDKEVLAAGDSTELEVIFSTKSYQNRTTKSPTIQTNEGTPDRHITIESFIVQRPDSTFPLLLNPYKIDLSQSTEKTVDQMEFSIQNVSEQKLDVKFISGANDLFKVELPQFIEPGKSAKGKLKLKESAIGLSFEKSFTIEVSDSAKSRFTVPVKRTIGTADATHISAGH